MHSTPPDTITTLETRDWRTGAQAVAGAYFPHELKPLATTDQLDLYMHTVDLGSVTIGLIRWGADVAIDCDYPEAFEMNMPLSGRLESVHSKETVVSESTEGTIFLPNRATPITCWTSDCTVVGVKFNRASFENEMERVTASLVRGQVTLPAQLSSHTEPGKSWLHFVRSLSTDLLHMGGILKNDIVKAQISDAITTGFIIATTPEDGTMSAARPGIVNRVLKRINDDPGRAWTVAAMAEVAGVSVRRLQEGFQEYVGMSPMACLRDIRLACTYEELVNAHDSATVTDIANRWGFSHPGRFAAAYRRKYGISPSESLRS